MPILNSLKFYKAIFLLSVLLIISFAGTAQQYHFSNFSVEDGLSQSQVRSICQDPKGYIWIGTLGGVSRFDGKLFVNYSEEDGLLNDEVLHTSVDKEGHVYFGTLGGFSFFDGTKFHKVLFDSAYADFYANDIIKDRSGKIWISTDGAGILCYENNEFKHYDTESGLPHDFGRCLTIDKKGQLWVGTQAGIAVWNGQSFSPTQHPELATVKTAQILERSNGELWIATLGQGSFRIAQRQLTQFMEPDGLVNDWIRSIAEDSLGNVWLASKTGLSKYDGLNFITFNQQDGLPQDNIKYLSCDEEGNLWMGTDGSGIIKFSGEAFVTFTAKDGLSNNLIMSITEDTAQNLWFATYGTGISAYNGSLFINVRNNDGLVNGTVWSSFTDSKNNVWFATSNGISRYYDKKFTPYRPGQEFSLKRFTSIFEDSRGNIWFGAKYGVVRYDGTTFSEFTADTEFIGENVRSIFEDKSGTIWFATKDGITLFDGKNFLSQSTKGLPDNSVVHTILGGREDFIWVGTSKGLYLYNGDSFRRIKINEDPRSNQINSMVFDEEGNLWLGTNNGLYELAPESCYGSKPPDINQYTNWEGIKGLECNLNAAFKDSQGFLWFGTSKGLIRYDYKMRNQRAFQLTPRVQIAELQLFLEKTDWNQYSQQVNPASGLPEELQVSHDQNYLTFNYIGIHHTNPEQVQYQFLLEGFDKHWSPWTKATSATYSNLPFGKYDFKVRASNGEGLPSATPASFSFEILPPFWRTWWFYILSAVVATLCIFGFVNWRLKVIERKKQTQQLVDKSKMMALEQQTLNAHMNRHFIFNALNSIQYYINMQDKLSANIYLSSFAKLVRKNLDSAQKDLVFLTEEMERLELYLSLENMRFSDKFTYQIEIDDDIDGETIRVPSMLLQPFVENSIRHGILPLKDGSGVIRVNVKQSNENIVFSIQDNGIGFDTSMERKDLDETDHVSKGMQITKDRINLMRKMTNRNIFIEGPFEIKGEEEVSVGTKVEITLPRDFDYTMN